MSRPAPKVKIPGYCRHAARGTAYVLLGGKVHYLPGRYGSAESRAAYDATLAAWMANGRQLPTGDSTTKLPAAGFANRGYTVVELSADYLEHAQTYYVKDGRVTGEVACLKSTIRVLDELYGDTPADAFGPRALLDVREAMIRKGWVRKYVNASIWRIKRIFGWGVTQEKIKGETHYKLQAVVSLRKGRSGTKDNPDVKPVPRNLVDAVLPLVSRQIRAMIELQLVTGMRPGEVVIMRACDLHDLDKAVWRYVPAHHKTEGIGEVRQVAIGPKGQTILRHFIKPDPQAYLFSPSEAERERRDSIHAARKTPASCGNTVGSNRVEQPKKQPGERYETRSYGQAIRKACAKAFPLPEALKPRAGATATPEQRAAVREWWQGHVWHAHQLRHSFGSMVRAEFGLDPVQATLGHKHAATSEIYAERNFKAAEAILAKVG